MVLVQKEIKKVYLGDTQVRPAFTPRTFTISWTEKSNMASGWTYSDDAAGLTAGSGDFDDFFGYSAVLLNTSGVETAEMTQTGGVFTGAMTTLGTLSGYDNVMIKFPARGIKMTKSGTTVTLSITDGLNRESEGYQYYAFQTGTLGSPGTPKDAMYLGAYKGLVAGGYVGSSIVDILRSWSGSYPSDGYTQGNLCTYAKNNGSGYNIMGFYQRMYVNALYMMKYGNPDCKTVVGQGYTNGRATTGGTNSQTSATYGVVSDQTKQVKLFGLEDWWGSVSDWLGGAYTNASKILYTSLTGWSGTLSGGESTGVTLYSGSNNCISSISGDNKGMFSATSAISDSSWASYYKAYNYYGANYIFYAGGNVSKILASLFTMQGENRNGSPNYVGARLMYLNGLT